MLAPWALCGIERLYGEVDLTEAVCDGADAPARVDGGGDGCGPLKGRERFVVLAEHFRELTASDVRRGKVGRRGGGRARVAERLTVGQAPRRLARGPEFQLGLTLAAAHRYEAVDGDEGAKRAAGAGTHLRRASSGHDEERDDQDAADEQDDQNPRPAARRAWSHCSVPPERGRNSLGTIVAFSGGWV